MTTSSRVFKAGTRPSGLALKQTRNALDRIEEILPGCSFEMLPISSVGDRDRTTDLRQSPADFFTRELDQSLLEGEIDCAVHSAKDLPDPMPHGIDWFWLPWSEEPRDVLIFAKGRNLSDLPENPVIGVSSERRAEYASAKFPDGIQKPIRGNIEERIAQLDEGRFDLIIMAAAALVRLNLVDRISEWISQEDLPVPEGQGHLAITFKNDDAPMVAIRARFVKSVIFAGAGAGGAETCTLATLRELQRCDICLYDSLADPKLLDELPAHAQAIYVGKRCGAHAMKQDAITALICTLARRGHKIVRLKGGDPGIFGRLAEETDALHKLQIPFRVIPGISAMQMATTATGMLLTRREVSRGFCAMTPRCKGGGMTPVTKSARADLPLALFMSINAADAVANELIDEGLDPETPAAVVFGAGSDQEFIIRKALKDISASAQAANTDLPGLLLIGDITQFGFSQKSGALKGCRVLLTCSKSLQANAVDYVRDFGGRPIQRPLIELCATNQAFNQIECIGSYDWIILTSPSAVRCFIELTRQLKIDFRNIPKIIVCGTGTSRALQSFGLNADAMPEKGFSAKALLDVAHDVIPKGSKILRLRSAKAGRAVTDGMRKLGCKVDDCIIYTNKIIKYESIPEFDAIFFASASAVKSFIEQWGVKTLENATILTIGKPTVNELQNVGVKPTVVSSEATVSDAIGSLASYYTVRDGIV